MQKHAFVAATLATVLGAFPIAACAGGSPSAAAEPAPQAVAVRAPQPSEPSRPAAPVLLSVQIVPDPEPATNAAAQPSASSSAPIVTAPRQTRP